MFCINPINNGPICFRVTEATPKAEISRTKETGEQNTWKMFGIRQKHFLYRPGTTTCQLWMKWQGHCKKKHHRV